MGSRSTRVTRTVAAVGVAMLVAVWPAAPLPAAAQITGVDEADDICPPAADPCIIDQEVQFQQQATIDFGTRTVELVPGGQLNSAAGEVVFSCGGFSTSIGSTETAILARTAADGGGSFTLEARRTCSDNPAQHCFSDSGCMFGACSAHVCAGDADVACGIDSDCNLGECQSGRCSNAFARLCASTDDCQLGTCETDATVCAGNLSRGCASDDDCDDGLCSVGTAAVSIDGKISANGSGNGPSGTVSIAAADDITTSGVINVEGGDRDNDGGVLDFRSGLGSVTLAGRINGESGRDATGGEVVMNAALDVSIDATIDITGGDFDGGTLDVTAGRDVSINGDVLARSTGGEGFGGSVTFDAGNDLTVAAGVQITTNGHESDDAFCGDGGPQTYDALGNMSVGSNARLEANGAAPDCAGETVSIVVGGDLTVSGQVQSRANGEEGSGGRVDIVGVGDVTLTTTSVVDATGGTAGAGAVDISAGNDLGLHGIIDARAEVGGASGSIGALAQRTATIAGALSVDGIVVAGSSGGTIEIDACSIAVTPLGQISNVGTDGVNRFVGRHDTVVEAGSQITADAASGANRFEYRDPAVPPVLQGTIVPTAQTVLDPLMEGCFLCGNGELDVDESCDDGDAMWESGQHCNVTCQMLACGDPDDSGNVLATDALIVLNTAVGAATCDACVCNVDNSAGAVPVTATDALGVLLVAVGLGGELVCPPCG